MKRIILYILILLIIIPIISGCGSKETELAKHQAFAYKNSTVKVTKDVKTIDINIDSGNLKIFSWDKEEIKYEAKHIVRDNKTDDQLDNMLKKYSIVSDVKDKIYKISVGYDGKITNAQDFVTDIELTIPRYIKKINISQQLGSIIVEDKIEGDIVAKLDSASTEIKSINGQLVLKGDSGNVRVNSGKLTNNSSIDISAGNIFVKAECQEQSKYSFQTVKGNIELIFPIDSNILIDSFGTVKNNQFTGVEGNINIKASTKMGKISVNGY